LESSGAIHPACGEIKPPHLAPAALVPAGTAPRGFFESDVGTGAARQPLADSTGIPELPRGQPAVLSRGAFPRGAGGSAASSRPLSPPKGAARNVLLRGPHRAVRGRPPPRKQPATRAKHPRAKLLRGQRGAPARAAAAAREPAYEDAPASGGGEGGFPPQPYRAPPPTTLSEWNRI